ncbi:hypothetical protein Bca4012_063489 [Brassica carinata]|uniref:Uncharacterized protein n=1 Tax=Brassica carinata TaxID=52824 RepID=A0A8X7V6Y6_BRACI|nr:hypothetical protein Bca52824_033093 [Brassica carinata]
MLSSRCEPYTVLLSSSLSKFPSGFFSPQCKPAPKCVEITPMSLTRSATVAPLLGHLKLVTVAVMVSSRINYPLQHSKPRDRMWCPVSSEVSNSQPNLDCS